jgi:hypothetical protein
MSIMQPEYQANATLICRDGHPVTAPPGRTAKACNYCGLPVFAACEQCGTPPPPFTEDAAALAHCTECGARYPWRTAMLERMKRTMDIESAAADWSPRTLELAYEFIDDLATLTMSTMRLRAVFNAVRSRDFWAQPTFAEVGRSLGTESVHRWLDAWQPEWERDREQ